MAADDTGSGGSDRSGSPSRHGDSRLDPGDSRLDPEDPDRHPDPYRSGDPQRHPGLDRPGGLIVMGGPMSVYQQTAHPWISAELGIIEEAIEESLPVLGVCLGAQMIAKALGSRVYKGEHGAEIGFGNVRLTDSGVSNPALASAVDSASGASDDIVDESPRIPVFHWHADTFDIPDGCVRLAESDLYPNQAFAMDGGVLALQFHIEIDSDLYGSWLPHLPGAAASASPGHEPRMLKEGPELEAALERVATAGARAFDEYFTSLREGGAA